MRSKKPAQILPSIFAADPLRLENDIMRMRNAGAGLFHFDIMDGHFVSNLGGGTGIMDAVGALGIRQDVHLMVDDPDKYIDMALRAKAEYITVHAESTKHLHRSLQFIKQGGAKAGVALNPATSPEVLEYVIDDVDMVLVMTCDPGAPVRSLIPNMAKKVARVNEMLDECNSSAVIEIDGCLNMGNVEPFISNGVEMVVMGNALFGAKDPADVIRQIAAL